MGEKPDIEIYVDGAGVRGLGGWGALLLYNGREKELSGSAKESTNNRMELTAPLMALRALKKPTKVTIYSDSEYVVNGMSKWVYGWERAGYLDGKIRPPSKFKEGEGEQLKNYELWRTLLEASRPHEITWKWVPGHSGVEGNERADTLAVLALADLKRQVAEEILGQITQNMLVSGPLTWGDGGNINPKPVFHKNGTFKSVDATISETGIPPFTLSLEGHPDRKYLLKIDLSKNEGTKKEKAKVIKVIRKFAKEAGKIIKSVKIPPEDFSFWERLQFKPEKGTSKARTFIFDTTED